MKNSFSLSMSITGIFLLLSILFANAQTVFVVTDSTDGNNPGQLRYAINQANFNTGASIIQFNIPAVIVNRPITLTLNNSLPSLKRNIRIDGTTQAGYSNGNPRIKIFGTSSLTGIRIDTTSNCKIVGLYIQNFLIGINIYFSNYCEVSNCIINQIYPSGITLQLYASSYCTIKGNFINTDKAGKDYSPIKPEEGIFLLSTASYGCTNNIIGGQACADGNTIAYTHSEGIDNAGTPSLNVNNTFSGNRIYSNVFNAINLRTAANANLASPVISTPAGCTLTGTSTVPFGIIEVFTADSGSTDKKSAWLFLGSTTANSSGAWTINLGIISGYAVTATIRDPATNNTSELASAVPITPSVFWVPSPVPGGIEGSSCLGKELTFIPTMTNVCTSNYVWNFGDGSPLTTNATHLFGTPGSFDVTATVYSQSGCAFISSTVRVNIGDPCPPPCENCIGSFAPEPGHYLISAWVKAETANPLDTTYTTPSLEVSFPSSGLATVSCIPSGRIIDGWQRIEGRFDVRVSNPPTMPVTSIKVDLKCASGTGNCLFDDIRIFPMDGSMKTYVYDPASKRLVAELDERNYTTFYEYDEEGKLVRVKKETERGIMTIKENRDNTNIR